MKARDNIIHSFRDFHYFKERRLKASSCAYNPYEQDKAIQSAEEQVSIANNVVKSATTRLTKHVDALETAVSNYFDKLHQLGVSNVPSAAARQISGPANDEPHSYASEAAYNPVQSSVASQAASASSDSMGDVLVSLKSGTGVIYSLVNKRNLSNK